MNTRRIQRRSLAATARFEGVGLFTGRPARCDIGPAPAGHGLTLAHAPGDPPLAATVAALWTEPVHPAFARIPPRHTALGMRGSAPFFTTEHVLGALAGLGVTDAVVLLEGPEFPIDDGSAAAIARACAAAGIADLDATIEPLVVRETLRVQSPDGRAFIAAEPADRPRFRYELDYGPDAPIAPQAAEWDGSPDRFLREIVPARTFSLAHEAAQMRALGLFAEFTPRDLPVVDDRGSLIDNQWRLPDEPARHKLLDLIGDLALVGRPIVGALTAVRAGHGLNHEMARLLVAHAG